MHSPRKDKTRSESWCWCNSLVQLVCRIPQHSISSILFRHWPSTKITPYSCSPWWILTISSKCFLRWTQWVRCCISSNSNNNNMWVRMNFSSFTCNNKCLEGQLVGLVGTNNFWIRCKCPKPPKSQLLMLPKILPILRIPKPATSIAPNSRNLLNLYTHSNNNNNNNLLRTMPPCNNFWACTDTTLPLFICSRLSNNSWWILLNRWLWNSSRICNNMPLIWTLPSFKNF